LPAILPPSGTVDHALVRRPGGRGEDDDDGIVAVGNQVGGIAVPEIAGVRGSRSCSEEEQSRVELTAAPVTIVTALGFRGTGSLCAKPTSEGVAQPMERFVPALI
jgi:hypothetical protein